jgi:hypothetical protein
MKPEEIIWIPDRKTHETLCRVCRRSLVDSQTIFHVEDELEDIENDWDDS